MFFCQNILKFVNSFSRTDGWDWHGKRILGASKCYLRILNVLRSCHAQSNLFRYHASELCHWGQFKALRNISLFSNGIREKAATCFRFWHAAQ
jgi:hypothetical protein